MATTEETILMRAKDNSGNDRLLYPITLADNVDGLAEALLSFGVPKVTATSTDGVAYTGTVAGITTLTAGITIVFVPSMTSTSKTPTFDLNGLGAKNVRRRLSGLSSMPVSGAATNWLFLNKPCVMSYDGSVWSVLNQDQPMASDLYGSVPVANGGVPSATTSNNGQMLKVVDGTPTWSEDDGGDAMPISGGTFTGAVMAGSSSQDASSYVIRNSKLSASAETPAVNGEICWLYE